MTSLQVFACLAHEASQGDSNRFPMGLVDDNVEATFDLTACLLRRMVPHLLARGDLEIDQRAKKMNGFYRGTDVVHVLWRLVDALEAKSHDFILAAKALKLMFSRCFNPIYDQEDKDTDDSSGSDSDHGDGMPEVGFLCRTWASWVSGMQVYGPVPALGVAFLATYHEALCSPRASSKNVAFRADGAIPPRCVVHLFLRHLGVKNLHSGLWTGATPEALYAEELKLFTRWFARCNACSARRNQARAYKRMHKRIRLMKEDSLSPDTEPIPAIGAAATWKAARAGQTKPVVVNGLIACRALKKSIVDVWGCRAVSLGTVPVESMWWKHHLRNVNRASVWATPAWRQFHAVVAWKKDVLTILPQCRESTGASRHTGWQQLVHELWYDLLPEDRDLVVLPPRGSGAPECIDEARVNVGFCDWLAR